MAISEVAVMPCRNVQCPDALERVCVPDEGQHLPGGAVFPRARPGTQTRLSAGRCSAVHDHTGGHRHALERPTRWASAPCSRAKCTTCVPPYGCLIRNAASQGAGRSASGAQLGRTGGNKRLRLQGAMSAGRLSRPGHRRRTLHQLSNALYDVGAEGRLPHRRAPRPFAPRSRLDLARGRDATVAWSYVDLRFAARREKCCGCWSGTRRAGGTAVDASTGPRQSDGTTVEESAAPAIVAAQLWNLR